MAEEIIWTPPEWPPEESGTYSANLKVEGTLKKVLPRRVKQAGGDGVLDYTAVHVFVEKTSRVADVLNESETRTALGPHSSTGYEGMFEMWLPSGAEMKSAVGDNVVCTTRGASQVLLSVVTQKKEAVVDPLAGLVAKLQKETAAVEQDGADDDEWDD